MGTNPWFRLYSKIITDPKVEFLSFEDQRHFVWLLCLKNEGYLDEKFTVSRIREQMIARKLGLQGEAFENAKTRLLEVGLIDGNWQPTAWNTLQFVSDQDVTRNARQKRYRDKLKKERDKKKLEDSTTSEGVTDRNALHNAQVTLIDADTDTDTESEGETRGRAQPPPDFEPDGLTRKKLKTQFPDVDHDRLIEHFKTIEFRIPKSWDARFWSHVLEVAPRFSKPGSASGNPVSMPNREPLECRQEFKTLEEQATQILRTKLAGDTPGGFRTVPPERFDSIGECVDQALAIASNENPDDPAEYAYSSLRLILLRRFDDLVAIEGAA